MTPTQAAQRFDAVLREWLTPAEYAEVLRRNGTPEYSDCCASHDFCDANMAMLDALGAGLAADDAMWCAAWNVWRESNQSGGA